MQDFTLNRKLDTPDEIWFCEHPPVFTLGRNGDPAHLLHAGAIEVVTSDRGGEVTYHGPGQLMMYCLMNLRARGEGPAQFVAFLESAVIALLENYGITAHLRLGMPGVYVDNQKIASLGLRIKKGCSYHGVALNVSMDLTPFQSIHPCGYPDLKMTCMANHIAPGPDLMDSVAAKLSALMRAGEA